MDMSSTQQVPAMRTYSLWQVVLAVLVLSLTANLIILYFTKPLAPDFMPLSFPPVPAFTVMGVLGAWGVFALIRKRAENPNRMFLWISLIVLALSFVPNILMLSISIPGLIGVTTAGVWVLMLMHVVTAGIVVPLFVRFAKPAQKSMKIFR